MMINQDPFIGKKIKDYTFIKLLGKGSFGSVYLVDDSLNKCLAACKLIDKTKITTKLRELINSEICVLFNCQHQNVVSYFTSFEDSMYVYIMMEYCNGGDVEQYTSKKGGRLTETQAKEFLKQIIKGFSAIRRINAVHRDFKPENVLMNNGVLKVADLGFSKILREQKETQTVLGTLFTMAPEIIERKPYGYKCDIWSIGIVYYKLLYGQYPYSGPNYPEMLKKIKKQPLRFPSNIQVSDQSKDFIMRCLVIEPTQRINWTQIQNHPLIKSNLTKVQIPLLKKQSLPKTKQFYIRNCMVLRIRNPPEFPNVELNSSITEERLADPIQKKVLQNRVSSYYQQLYLAIREYIANRVTDCISIILELINKIPGDYHSVVGYIISRETLRQITQILQSLKLKQNILQFKHLVNQFFQSQEYKLLIEVFKNDQGVLVHYISQFKALMKQEDIQKLQANQINVVDKVLQRERRYIAQYSIQLFNYMQNIDKKLAMMVLKLIQFLIDEVRCLYKDPILYSKFVVGNDLKDIWYSTRDKLGQLRKDYQ